MPPFGATEPIQGARQRAWAADPEGRVPPRDLGLIDFADEEGSRFGRSLFGSSALAGTRDPVYLATSSAWGVMEGALRNVTRRKVLNCMNGAFSDKWYDV